jgi:hypothetical protein
MDKIIIDKGLHKPEFINLIAPAIRLDTVIKVDDGYQYCLVKPANGDYLKPFECFISNNALKLSAYKKENNSVVSHFLTPYKFFKKRGVDDVKLQNYINSIALLEFDFVSQNQDLEQAYDYTEISSCMQKEGVNFRTLTKLNPALNVQLFQFFKNADEVARVLVWKNVFLQKDDTKVLFAGVVDRIYAVSNTTLNAVKNYFLQRGYVTRARNDLSTCTSFLVQDLFGIHQVELKIYVQLDKCVDNKKFPYMDTFCYLDDDYRLHNSYAGAAIETRRADGNALISGTECCCCGHIFDDNDIIIDDDGYEYCDNCYHNRYCACEVCGEEMSRDESGDYIPYHNVCSRCARDYVIRCANCGEIIGHGWGTDAHHGEICEACQDALDNNDNQD